MKLKIGDRAPAIHASDENGNRFVLDELRGRKVVLYFYPKDDTPGCTAESCNLRDNYLKLNSLGYEVVGVSADSERSHQKFIRKYRLPFRLLADTDRKVLKDYGVWGPKKLFGRKYEGIIRTTFVIDEKGIIESIISDVDTRNHSEQVLSAGSTKTDS